MIKKKSSLLYISAFIIITCISVVTLHHKKNQLTKNKNFVDSFAIQATYSTFNHTGQLQTKLTTKHLRHFASSKTTLLDQPNMLTYTVDRKPWHISANHGKSFNQTKSIYLWGNVIIKQHSKKSAAIKTIIKTPSLTFYPKTSQAITKSIVYIYRDGSTLHGKGLKANLKTGTYQLLSQSQGIYTPDKQPTR